ncbi:hypothetical protein [Mycobacterium tuberculosis]|uniref:hypothetical protein n=1 Tax=Mycobacterium tuberculosis TaxID=1773 RepID=UPI00272D61D5|nr:hypothetical protein [Mycobacterium tuberculosis]
MKAHMATGHVMPELQIGFVHVISKPEVSLFDHQWFSIISGKARAAHQRQPHAASAKINAGIRNNCDNVRSQVVRGASVVLFM